MGTLLYLLYNSECFPIKLIWYTYGYVIVPCCITQCFSYLINLSGPLMGTLLYLVVFYDGVLCDDDVHWPSNLQKQTQGVKQSHPFRGSLLSTLIYTKLPDSKYSLYNAVPGNPSC